jgi:hypothetical protein
MYDVCLSGAVYVFMYFDMFYIQWHRLAKKDLWNKEYDYDYIGPMIIPIIFLLIHKAVIILSLDGFGRKM